MYLIHAPKSKRFGYEEPRAYLDVRSSTNFSTIQNKTNRDYIETKFDKVRIIMSKINHETTYKIDISDFTYAKTNGGEILSDNKLFDVSLYGVAYVIGKEN